MTVDPLPDTLESLAVRRYKEVAEVTLLGPGKGNAMGPAFWRELPLVFEALDSDPDVRSIVLTGSGSHFSYGLDLPTMTQNWAGLLREGGLAEARTSFMSEIRQLQSAVDSVAHCRKPVVAAIAGWCIGGGVDLIAAADIRVASADTSFSVREVKVAIVADLGSLQRLVGIIGEGHLRELALTGTNIDAARAEKIGLVNDTYPDKQSTLDAAHALAKNIATNPPLTVRGIKEILDQEREPRIAAGLRHVSVWNAAFLPSEDLREALAAFAERREPKFHGR